MEDPKKFRDDKFAPFEKTDIKPYMEQMDREVKALAAVSGYDIKPIGADGFSISIDVQEYIDDAVRKLRDSVASQVETNLQALLKVAFDDVVGRHTACFDAGDVEEMWRDFLRLLSITASSAVNVSEERR
jgi:hypothetical protein